MDDKKSFSAYTEVFVVFRHGDYDISEIFLDKSLAETECIKRNEIMKKMSYPEGYKVMFLDDVIDSIKDVVKWDSDHNED